MYMYMTRPYSCISLIITFEPKAEENFYMSAMGFRFHPTKITLSLHFFQDFLLQA